jgi:N-acetylglucosamine malate deacetylase 1
MKVLVVVAHPDDEVLGCGATIAKHVAAGDDVVVKFLSDGVGARGAKASEVQERREMAENAAAILGLSAVNFGTFPDNGLDTVPLLEVVQDIEQCLAKESPDTLYTHHNSDLNIDHQIVHRAVMTACRPQPGFPVKCILSMEVASSTEWSAETQSKPFVPNYFVTVEDFFDKKLQAMKAYEKEMRAFPHVRSGEAIEALAKWRGASVGEHKAEAFVLERLVD